MSSSLGRLLGGTLLALLTAALLILVSRVDVLSGVTQVVMIISGMTAMGALTAFQRFLESGEGSPLGRISFNEMFLSRSISEGSPKFDAASSGAEREQPSIAAWDLTAGHLVGTDNELALARLRIDVERELRRIAHEAKIDLSARPLGATALASELVRREFLPAMFLEALQQIMMVCNRGIHGEKVSNDVAAAVVRVGGQLLEQLRRLPQQCQK